MPEVADYEIRRELLRARKTAGIEQLDHLCELLEYLPINTAAMRMAAQLWAQARQQGQPTANDNTIDADMILAAQALTSGASEFVIATTNVGHLARFVTASLWSAITAAQWQNLWRRDSGPFVRRFLKTVSSADASQQRPNAFEPPRQWDC